MASNYAPTLLPGKIALQHGCAVNGWLAGPQVLRKDWIFYLFLTSWQELLTESGATNLFIVGSGEDGKQELITPPTSSGLILPGVSLSENYSDMIQITQA